MTKARELLIKAFPAAYVASGLNGTHAYKSIKKRSKLSTARAEAPGILAIPSVQKAIEALLPSEDETMQVLRDAYSAKREDTMSYKDLHKFWETDLKLRGKLKDTGGNTTNVAIISSK